MIRVLALSVLLMSVAPWLATPAAAQRNARRSTQRSARQTAPRTPPRLAQPDPSAEDAPPIFLSAGGSWEWLNIDYVQINESLNHANAFSVQGTSTTARDPAALIGVRAMLGVRKPDGTYALRHGFVEDVTYSPNDLQGQHTYSIQVVPWVRLLRQTATCEIFENLSVPAIVRRIFARQPFSDVDFRLSRRYPRRIREVQYRETDLNFVQRILEQEGLYYFVEQSNAGHKLVITDAETRPRGNLRLVTSGSSPNRVERVQRHVRLRPNTYSLADVTADGTILRGSATEPSRAGLELTIFDYPGEFSSSREAERHANIRLDELRSRGASLSGSVANSAIGVGQGIRIDGRPFLVTELSTMTGATDLNPSVQFTAVPRSQIYRPSRVTPKPVVQGMQTATVVAVEGRRIRVRFPWEREREGGALGTWVPAQSPTSIPVGTRVLMAFDEGDPNRPILVQALGI